MVANPAVGVVYHWLGGLASGSFYVPYKGVKRWAWETYWLAGGFFSWIIAPWILAFLITKDLLPVLHEAPASAIFWAFFFGLLWGVGGLTFGLTMRYLGLSLGMAVVLGLCAAFGTLMPPIFRGVFMSEVVGTTSGRVILLGIMVCLAGITAAGLAGISKERVMSPEQQKRSEEHTSELQSRRDLVCRLLLEKKNKTDTKTALTCPMPITSGCVTQSGVTASGRKRSADAQFNMSSTSCFSYRSGVAPLVAARS